MNRTEAFPKRASVATGQHRLHLSEDGKRNFFGVIGAKIKAHRCMQARAHLGRDGEPVRRQI
jgi:hypothetical protein